MLKKMLISTLCLLLAVGLAFAESNVQIPEKMEPKSVLEKFELFSKTDFIDEIDDAHRAGGLEEGESVNNSGLSIPLTTDQVTVEEDGAITVTTEGVFISVLPPFGTVAISQDVLTQYDTYSSFTDPGSVVEYLQELNAHLWIYDMMMNTEIYVITSDDSLSGIINDIDRVDKATLDLLVSKIQQMESGTAISLEEFGEHRYLLYDYRGANKELMIYTTIKNNVCVDFYLTPGSETISEDEIEMMESLLTDASVLEV